jgi:hypothetical protein
MLSRCATEAQRQSHRHPPPPEPSPVALHVGAASDTVSRQVALRAPCTLTAAVQWWGVLPAACTAGASTAACVVPRLQSATHTQQSAIIRPVGPP